MTASRRARPATAPPVTGLGIRTAGKIFYNAMLSKTSGMTYLQYRTATLNAAKNLFPASCAEFNTSRPRGTPSASLPSPANRVAPSRTSISMLPGTSSSST